MRKLLSILGIVALLGLAMPSAALANTGTCSGLGLGHIHFAGWRFQTPNLLFDNIGAYVDISATDGHFDICSAIPTDFDDNGAFAWVAIVPGSSNPEWGNTNAIIQIGIARCASFGNSTCAGSGNTPHFFYGVGGCNGHIPIVQDLGPADYGQHRYEMTETSGTWLYKIDNSIWHQTVVGSSYINCWINGDLDAQLLGEKWDPYDSLGNSTSSLTKTQYRGIRYSYNGYGFITPDLTGRPCNILDLSQDHCQVVSPGSGFDLWTTN